MTLGAKLLKRFGILLGLFLMASSVGAATSSHVELRDDAYHFPYYNDGQHDANFIEWWYFNFYDEVQDIQVAFTYSILDPKNVSTLGRAGVQAIVYTPDGSFDEVRFFPTDAFHASTERADVVIAYTAADPENFIEVLDDDAYHIVGNVENGHRISWDLTYVRESPSFLGGAREKVGLFPWEEMSWVVYMPEAKVSGEVVIDGRSYCLSDVRGYHDHNWGEWILTTVTWNWAQYNGPGLTLALGDFINKDVGEVFVDFQGCRTVFEKNQYRLLHTRWTYDPESGRRFPARTWLYAESEKKLLIVRLDTIDTQAVLPPPDIPFLLSKPIIYEQTARYTGRLWEKNQQGQWELAVPFEGDGFKEYTARQWLVPRRPE